MSSPNWANRWGRFRQGHCPSKAICPFLVRMVESDNAWLRRFVAETLRPGQENRWFYTQPDYPLTVPWHLFREGAPYPRTSVGNGLSDLARRLPDLVYRLIEELMATDDKNSYWIAYRACRNLVKRDPSDEPVGGR